MVDAWLSAEQTTGRHRPGTGLSRFLLLLLLAGASATPLPAQLRPDTLPADSTVIEIEAVVVRTLRAVTTPGGTSALQISPDSLAVGPAPTLEAVLREIPFVGIRENSRGEAEITMRGSESRQVAVLLDGVPLTLGWDHRTDPSLIPITGAQSMTLVRGLHSVLYGPNVLGGVIEVDVSQGSLPLEVPPRVQLRAGVDHLGGRSLGVVGGRSIPAAAGDLRVRGGAGYRTRPGVPLPSGVSNTEGGEAGLRINSDTEQLNGFLALRYQDLDGRWLGVSASGYRAERGVPPELHLREPRLWRYPDASRLLAVLSGGTGQRATILGTGDLEASLGIDLGSTQIESFESLAYDRVEGTESSDDRTLTLRLLGDHTLGSSAVLRGALTLADVHHDERIDGGGAVGYRQRLWSAGTEVTLPVARGARISGGLVMDGADTPESGDKPPLGRLSAWGGRLGASALALEGTVRLHAAVSRRARFPSLRELYSGALGRFVPNPDLAPEILLGAEAGATTRRGGGELQAVLFHHRLSDAIVRASMGDGSFRRENRDQIRSTGLELLAGWNRKGFSLLGDLLLQDVRLLDPAEAGGERRPEHQPALRAGLDATVPLPLDLRALVGATYTGRQFCVHPDLEREVELGGSGRTDAALQHAWYPDDTRRGWFGSVGSIRTTLSLGNVTDAALYDQCGLPQPGRTLRLMVEIG